jgi:hypothetical protein
MIGVYFPKSAMTDEQYKSIDNEVTAGSPPAGLKLHTCFREGDGLAMYDVRESQEAFEAFGAKPKFFPSGITLARRTERLRCTFKELSSG